MGLAQTAPAMILNVGCTLDYEVLTPTAHFTFNVLVNTDAQQRLVAEELAFTPDSAPEKISSSKGNRVVRVEAQAGQFELRYSATVETLRPLLPDDVGSDNPGRLPLTVLTYMLPSRYCESDRFAQAAWEQFGSIENRAEQVREICRWVDANLEYKKGATDGRTSAWDVWQNRQGVCRDYAHLSIALCRALNIPARYVGGFGVGLDPMDFHACFEAYLGGTWYLFDPTDRIEANDIAIIARGRDAANAALTTIFGKVKNAPTIVTAVRADPPPAPETQAVS